MEQKVETAVKTAKVATKSWWDKFDFTWTKALRWLAYAAVGFFVGLLLKKHFRATFVLVISLILLLLLMDYYHVVTIGWTKIYSWTGIGPKMTVASLLAHWLTWIKTNILVVISAFIGFVIGYKVG